MNLLSCSLPCHFHPSLSQALSAAKNLQGNSTHPPHHCFLTSMAAAIFFCFFFPFSPLFYSYIYCFHILSKAAQSFFSLTEILPFPLRPWVNPANDKVIYFGRLVSDMESQKCTGLVLGASATGDSPLASVKVCLTTPRHMHIYPPSSIPARKAQGICVLIQH